MAEFATNDEHSDSSSDFPDLDDVESIYSSDALHATQIGHVTRTIV